MSEQPNRSKHDLVSGRYTGTGMEWTMNGIVFRDPTGKLSKPTCN